MLHARRRDGPLVGQAADAAASRAPTLQPTFAKHPRPSLAMGADGRRRLVAPVRCPFPLAADAALYCAWRFARPFLHLPPSPLVSPWHVNLTVPAPMKPMSKFLFVHSHLS